MHRRALLGLAAAYVTLHALPAFAASHTVVIKGMKFSPKNLRVAVGDRITFVNQDSVSHTATAIDGAFDTGRLRPGQGKRVTIGAAGEHNYICRIHPSMKGSVTTTGRVTIRRRPTPTPSY
jgi:plastocyanin